MSQPLLLGHRGARATHSVPENTIASFDLALEHGCDGFEFDVRLTADGRAVIAHDPEIDGLSIAHAGSSDLKDLPLLDPVLSRYQATAFLDLEIKVPGLEPIVLRALQKHPPHKGYVVSSFLPEALLALRSLDLGMPLGLICETTAQFKLWRELPVQFVAPHHTLIDIDVMKDLKAAGRRVLAWTVNTLDRMAELCDLGVDGLISDRTELLGRLRQ